MNKIDLRIDVFTEFGAFNAVGIILAKISFDLFQCLNQILLYYAESRRDCNIIAEIDNVQLVKVEGIDQYHTTITNRIFQYVSRPHRLCLDYNKKELLVVRRMYPTIHITQPLCFVNHIHESGVFAYTTLGILGKVPCIFSTEEEEFSREIHSTMR